MDKLTDKINQLAKRLGKTHIKDEYIAYDTLRAKYQAQAQADIQQLQAEAKQNRIEQLHGRADLNPKWRFETLIEDADDISEAISIAQSFIAAHDDPQWRNERSHMMIFYGDYGRGKSHLAGAIAHTLIEQYEINVLYRQLSSLLDMRLFSFDYQAQDQAGEKFRQIQQQLLDVDLLILDEVCVNETTLKPNAQSWLGNLLRQRLANHKNCILITNHRLDRLEQAVGTYCFESIKEYETYKVKFTGPSRRKAVADNVQATTSVTNQYQPNQVK